MTPSGLPSLASGKPGWGVGQGGSPGAPQTMQTPRTAGRGLAVCPLPLLSAAALHSTHLDSARKTTSRSVSCSRRPPRE